MSPTSARIAGRAAVITGGTDGMGAATALRLRAMGADVLIIGRSQQKADSVVARAAELPGPGSLRALVADFSEMCTVETTVTEIAGLVDRIDLLVHAVGILISRTEHTNEGIEKDFAVSYLSRFVFLETAAHHGLLSPHTRMVNLAASSPKVPRYAQLEFAPLQLVEARVGMKSHGQAQLANDLLTAQAGARYGITAIGYGPGTVDTNIRREVPAALRAAMRPFFALTTRNPDQAAEQIVDHLGDATLEPGSAHFANKHGYFPIAAYIDDPARQSDLLAASLTLADRARHR